MRNLTKKCPESIRLSWCFLPFSLKIAPTQMASLRQAAQGLDITSIKSPGKPSPTHASPSTSQSESSKSLHFKGHTASVHGMHIHDKWLYTASEDNTARKFNILVSFGMRRNPVCFNLVFLENDSCCLVLKSIL